MYITKQQLKTISNSVEYFENELKNGSGTKTLPIWIKNLKEIEQKAYKDQAYRRIKNLNKGK